MRRARKRGNGEGTTYPVRDRNGKVLRYAAVLVVGWTLDGKPIRRSRSASSEAAAKRLLVEMRRARDVGREIPDERLSVGAWLARWLERQRIAVRPTTYRAYRFAIERFLLSELGTIPLRRLRPSRVTTLIAGMVAYSPHTAASVRAVLRQALADAERDGLVEQNAARLARVTLRAPEPARIPSEADVRAVLAALADHRLGSLYRLAAATGLRLGEITGLRLGDLDDDRLHVRVQLQATRNPAEPFVLAAPKTEGSGGTVPLGPAGQKAVAAAKAQRAADRLRMGRGWRDRSDLLFTTAEGDPLHPNTVRWVLGEAQKRAGVEAFPFHSFRRFQATLHEADRSAARAILRHEDERTTKRYIGLTDAATERALARIEEAIG